LDVDMDVVHGDDERTLVAADRPIATARRIAAVDGTPPPGVDLETAQQVTGALRDFNPFGRCMICGHQRDDSLRVWPGPLPGDAPGVATAFTVPDHFSEGGKVLATPFAFGALDCTSGFAVLRESDGGLVITGTMQVHVERPVPASAPIVATARVADRGRRTWRVDAALHSADGDRLARAHVTWVDIDASVLG
jgi:acyl-coenzyme A thioesterase PaaI-like protein